MPQVCKFSIICGQNEKFSTVQHCVASNSTKTNEALYLQTIYTQPTEEFEQVNLQTVQGQAPIKISLENRELVKKHAQEIVLIKQQ